MAKLNQTQRQRLLSQTCSHIYLATRRHVPVELQISFDERRTSKKHLNFVTVSYSTSIPEASSQTSFERYTPVVRKRTDTDNKRKTKHYVNMPICQTLEEPRHDTISAEYIYILRNTGSDVLEVFLSEPLTTLNCFRLPLATRAWEEASKSFCWHHKVPGSRSEPLAISPLTSESINNH